MYEQLQQFLLTKGSPNLGAIADINLHFKQIKTRRKDVLVDLGQVCKKMYFINKGCLRLYEIDDKGNEVTGYFAFENRLFTSLPSFIMQKPSRDYLVSHEPCELLEIDRNSFFKLMNKHEALQKAYNDLMEFAFIHSQMRIYTFLGMEGIDRLRWVIEHEPELLTRISSKAVASYLGLTNSTLSKLKAKL